MSSEESTSQSTKGRYFAGIDIGSRGAKAVILKDDETYYAIGDTLPDSMASAPVIFKEVAKSIGTGVEPKDMAYTVATGYGRVLVPFANKVVSEISCHAKGVHFRLPTARLILDMGGQDCKSIRVNEDGSVANFIMNDKCAGGTGRFLETIAAVLELTIEEIGPLAVQSTSQIEFSTVCAVFAKAEAVSRLTKGVSKADILAGLHDAIASRAVNLLRRVDIQPDFTMTGGISKNVGMVKKVVAKVGLEPIMIQPDPQIAGALGAALFAREKWAKEEKTSNVG